MFDARNFIQVLFANNQVPVPKNRAALLDRFVTEIENMEAISRIVDNQNLLMGKWNLENRVADIIQQPVRILNATVGKPYEARFDPVKFKWHDIADYEIVGLAEVGLMYDDKTKQITGIPVRGGDFTIILKFKMTGEADNAVAHEKPISLIINPDARSLWKNLPGDRNDPYWKEDDVSEFAPISDRHILVSSKRGRAHANIGSFREDGFAYKNLLNDWSIVVVADGAGSAKLSRKGSSIACQAVVDYFSADALTEKLASFEELLHLQENSGDEAQKKLNLYMYDTLGKAAFGVHKILEAFAAEAQVAVKDLASTLIFTLFKKFDAGYAFLSFSVGDCPMAVLSKDLSEVHLLNWLDVGEYGGGTRFITMPEIFQNEKFASRFSCKLLPDFSFLVMMSDGIYDPKFVVEANLPRIKMWKEFLADLDGKNEDGIRVEFSADNKDITNQLSSWIDFWSQGNHDDRTLAIVF